MTTTEKAVPVTTQTPAKSARQRATPTKALAKPAPKAPAAPLAIKPPLAATTTSKAKASATETKSVKEKKPKLVRDSLTMPKAEYAVLDELKLRAAKLSSPIKKTELIRAGIKALAAMSDTAFLAAAKAVPSLKTGRPSK
jgi:hypothetical protein